MPSPSDDFEFTFNLAKTAFYHSTRTTRDERMRLLSLAQDAVKAAPDKKSRERAKHYHESMMDLFVCCHHNSRLPITPDVSAASCKAVILQWLETGSPLPGHPPKRIVDELNRSTDVMHPVSFPADGWINYDEYLHMVWKALKDIRLSLLPGTDESTSFHSIMKWANEAQAELRRGNLAAVGTILSMIAAQAKEECDRE